MSVADLPQPEQVLVSLILKNTGLNQSLVEGVVSEFQSLNGAGEPDLAHFFVDRGHLTRTQMYKLVKARNFSLLRKEDKRIIRRAVRRGYIARTQMNEALDFQRQLFKALGDIKRLEEILVDDGRLTREQIEEIWNEYRQYLARRGERPVVARTDPSLLRRQG